MMYHQARAKIMEEIPCSRSTATKALKWMEKQQKTEKTAKPSITVAQEDKKTPEFIEPTEKTIEEITPEPEKPITEITPAETAEQLEIFRDMLRGLHVILFAEGGLVDLLVKGGTSEKQAKQVSDQLYRWLVRRYSTEQLERWDTIFLVASYGTMAGTIIKKAMEHRKKEKNKK